MCFKIEHMKSTETYMHMPPIKGKGSIPDVLPFFTMSLHMNLEHKKT